MKIPPPLRLAVLLGLSIFSTIHAAPAAIKDIEYAKAGDTRLRLDLYPAESQRGPLIVYIHGGAWRGGSKNEMPLKELVEAGYPAASIEYRLSTAAKFPAQAYDIKAAIRFLRGEARNLKIDASRIVIAGSSAGGHLAALIGVSNGVKELEGDLGAHTDQSSDVQGIISFFGGSDLTTILAQSTPKALEMRVPALELLLGGKPDEQKELARLASPVFHVDKNDPPLLLFHGDQDPQMPVNQSLELEGAYEKAGAKVRLKILHGAGHGGKVFYAPEQIALIKDFLRTFFASR